MDLWGRIPTGRRTAVLASLGTAALLAGASSLGGPGGVTTAAAATGGGETAAAVCDPGADAHARVVPGSEGADPNSLTAQQSAAYDADLQAQVTQRRLADRAEAERASTITVDVRVHAIARDDGTGAVTRTMVTKQISVLNQAYAGHTSGQSASTPFRFRLATFELTRNTDWYNWTQGDDDQPAKQALHQGGMDDLNLYIPQLSGGLLGYATFPQDKAGVRDGVVVTGDSLPGGSAAPYNKGDTATHEVGHWLGLFHTFQNGCSAPGDFVNDTPFQNNGQNVFMCNESADTCHQPGRDPVHNFMSYGNDVCLDRFSVGQSSRMLTSWLAYRD